MHNYASSRAIGAGTASRVARGSLTPRFVRVPRLPGPEREVGAGGLVRVSGCSVPRACSITGSSAAYWSRAPAASPPARVSLMNLRNAAFVTGWPSTHRLSTSAVMTGLFLWVEDGAAHPEGSAGNRECALIGLAEHLSARFDVGHPVLHSGLATD